MIHQLKKLAMAAGAFAMAMTIPISAPVNAAYKDRAGPARSQARPNINRPQSQGGNYNNRPAGGYANNNRPGGGYGNNNRPGGGYGNNNRPGGGYANNNRPNNRPGGGGYNNVGNTVVVAPPRGGGYNNNYNNGYNNGYNNNYNNNDRWEDDDNDFLDFVGKTAAITAGASILAKVIGSTTKEKPDDCIESMSNGQVYMNCNGTWYQPAQTGGQSSYTVVAPPK